MMIASAWSAEARTKIRSVPQPSFSLTSMMKDYPLSQAGLTPSSTATKEETTTIIRILSVHSRWMYRLSLTMQELLIVITPTEILDQ